jgi:uncharacterized protein (DUF1778 family)
VGGEKNAHGMPRPSISKRKTECLAVRVSSDDKRRIERAAALSGQSVSSFVGGHARDAAERIVERHDRMRLNAEESKRFVEGLLAPARKALESSSVSFRELQENCARMLRSSAISGRPFYSYRLPLPSAFPIARRLVLQDSTKKRSSRDCSSKLKRLLHVHRY